MRFRGSIYFDFNCGTKEEAADLLYKISKRISEDLIYHYEDKMSGHYVGRVASYQDLIDGKDDI